MKQTKEQLMAEVREQNKLFNAAPDLLASLKTVTSPDFQAAYRDGLAWAVEAQTKALAAIAKAT